MAGEGDWWGWLDQGIELIRGILYFFLAKIVSNISKKYIDNSITM